MPYYGFSVQNADGRDREYVGCIALRDDDEACAFGDAMIWDMRDAAAFYEGWTLHVADGERVVCIIQFENPERIPARLLCSHRGYSDDI
jgi:hypothetical protein